MNKENYKKIKEAYDILVGIDVGVDSDLERFDREQIEEAQKTLAWTIIRWSSEFENE